MSPQRKGRKIARKRVWNDMREQSPEWRRFMTRLVGYPKLRFTLESMASEQLKMVTSLGIQMAEDLINGDPMQPKPQGLIRC